MKIFFSGIAGSGVSAIAAFMANKNHTIVGSDRAFDTTHDHPLKQSLQAKGITIVPQDGNGLDASFDLAIFSTAVEPDRPEAHKAKTLGIPVKTRPEYLANITEAFHTIAISGTSGKSTVAGLLAFLMDRLGLEPNFIGGGRVKQFQSSSNPGNSLSGNSDYLIIEACESDGTIVNYKPHYSLILNLSLDHHTVDETSRMFEKLMDNTLKTIIINTDDLNLNRLNHKGSTTFSIHRSSDYRAENIEYRPFRSIFTVNGQRFSLSQPGECNIYDALACIAILSELGTSLKRIATFLPDFRGIKRRFDVHLHNDDYLVIDDYAHNPHKINAMMQTLKQMRKRICYLFQPHGYGPTRLMKKEYIATFVKNLRDDDHLILLPIFYAGGTTSRDISSKDLATEISASGKSVEVIEKRDDVLNRLHAYNSYVIFGARDETLSILARNIAKRLSQQKQTQP